MFHKDTANNFDRKYIFFMATPNAAMNYSQPMCESKDCKSYFSLFSLSLALPLNLRTNLIEECQFYSK